MGSIQQTRDEAWTRKEKTINMCVRVFVCVGPGTPRSMHIDHMNEPWQSYNVWSEEECRTWGLFPHKTWERWVHVCTIGATGIDENSIQKCGEINWINACLTSIKNRVDTEVPITNRLYRKNDNDAHLKGLQLTKDGLVRAESQWKMHELSYCCSTKKQMNNRASWRENRLKINRFFVAVFAWGVQLIR